MQRCNFLVLILVVGCGDDGMGTSPDAAADGGAAACEADSDCDDGVFCNGAESCSAGDCESGTPPCSEGRSCNEATDACETQCEESSDADSDGSDAMECGGDDCDDGNADRFPGNQEVCDVANLDEDCDPDTFGTRDEDADGYIDALCCNGELCGDDCDDSEASVHPTEAESCDELDNDCDGNIDEAGGRLFYTDADGDGFGDPAGETQLACRPPAGFVENNTDCDDSIAGRNPGLAEVCDMIPDNDCNEETTPFDDDEDGYDRTDCGGNDCNDSDARVYPGAPEACDGVDNDCSSGGGQALDEDADGDNHASTGADCVGGFPTDDCNDSEAAAYPGSPEVCDGVDNDCNGATDEQPAADNSCQFPGTTATCGLMGACVIDSCSEPLRNCNGVTSDGCEANVQTDPVHCGTCGFPCPVGGECNDGLCSCPSGTLDCLTSCADIDSDPDNCGDCGRACPEGSLCTGGVCACPAGTELCGAACVNTDITTAHCGTCDNDCGLGNQCVDGGCMVSPITRVDAGAQNVCVVRENGTQICWGSGLLRWQTTEPVQATPIVVEDVSNAIASSSADNFGFALLSTGEILSWGDGMEELGRPPMGDIPRPAPVSGIDDAIDIDSVNAQMIAQGQEGPRACAVRASGLVQCWGRGMLGRTDTESSFSPVSVLGITSGVGVSLGKTMICVLRSDNRVACWGFDDEGQLGDGSTGMGLSPTPTLVVGLSDAVEISAGDSTVCARRVGGLVSCWGRGYGPTPTEVTVPGVVEQISLGSRSACVVNDSNDVYCWAPGETPALSASGAVEVSVGGPRNGGPPEWEHVCIRTTAGGVSCWGEGNQGQLGDGQLMRSDTPVVALPQ